MLFPTVPKPSNPMKTESSKLALLTALTLAAASASAADGTAATTWHPNSLLDAVGYAALFAGIGVVLMIAGFKVFDKAVAHVDLEKEIQKGNVAAAVLAGAVIIALGLIIAAAISG